MASMPWRRMGPPVRNFAADAYDCIMVKVAIDPPNTRLCGQVRTTRRVPSDRGYPALWPTEVRASAEHRKARGWQAHRPRWVDYRRRLGPRKGWPAAPACGGCGLDAPRAAGHVGHQAIHGQERAANRPQAQPQSAKPAKNTGQRIWSLTTNIPYK